MGFNTRTIFVSGNQMSDLVGYGLLHECLDIVAQDLLIVANQGVVSRSEDHHAGGFTFKVKT
jgi:hypothetical protein